MRPTSRSFSGPPFFTPNPMGGQPLSTSGGFPPKKASGPQYGGTGAEVGTWVEVCRYTTDAYARANA